MSTLIMKAPATIRYPDKNPIFVDAPDMDSLRIPYYTFDPDYVFTDVDATVRANEPTYEEVMAAGGTVYQQHNRRLNSQGLAGYDLPVEQGPFISLTRVIIGSNGRKAYSGFFTSPQLPNNLDQYLSGVSRFTIITSSYLTNMSIGNEATISSGATTNIAMKRADNNTTFNITSQTLPAMNRGLIVEGEVAPVRTQAVVVDKINKVCLFYGEGQFINSVTYQPLDSAQLPALVPVAAYGSFYTGFAVANRILTPSEISTASNFFRDRLLPI